MRSSPKLRAIFLILGSLLLFQAVPLSWCAENGDITIILTGYDSTNGMLRVALFDDEREFEKRHKGRCIHASIKPDSKGTTRITIKDVPPNTYACVVMHDANNNGKIDANFLMIPVEGYGMSNYTDGKPFIPTFKNALFKHDKEDREMKIRIVYILH